MHRLSEGFFQHLSGVITAEGFDRFTKQQAEPCMRKDRLTSIRRKRCRGEPEFSIHSIKHRRVFTDNIRNKATTLKDGTKDQAHERIGSSPESKNRSPLTMKTAYINPPIPAFDLKLTPPRVNLPRIWDEENRSSSHPPLGSTVHVNNDLNQSFNSQLSNQSFYYPANQTFPMTRPSRPVRPIVVVEPVSPISSAEIKFSPLNSPADSHLDDLCASFSKCVKFTKNLQLLTPSTTNVKRPVARRIKPEPLSIQQQGKKSTKK